MEKKEDNRDPIISVRLPQEMIDNLNELAVTKAEEITQTTGMKTKPQRAVVIRMLLVEGLKNHS